jgi:hypothetical protein
MDWSKVLTIQDVSVVGLVIAFSGIIGSLFLSGRLFTKGQMDDKIEECAKLSAALEASTIANQQCAKDYQAMAISAARFEERANMQQWIRGTGPQ